MLADVASAADVYKRQVLKAQAVLVRTNVYRKIQEGGSKVEFSDDFWTQKEMEKEWGACLLYTSRCV